MTRILALILLLLTALPAQAQEQSANGFVERLLESVLSAEGRSLSIQDTSISLTGDVTVGRVEVRDGEDAWLVIENLSLVWRPLSLFGKQLEVTSLRAARVHVLRMPRTPEGSVSAPQELQDLTAAAIKQLEIATLQIDQPVLGQDVELRLVGSGEITAEPVQILADLTASRLDGKIGDLRLKLALDPRTRNVQASVSFSEEADGILANLLSLRGDPSVDLALEAAGTYADWKATFSLDLDKARVFDGDAAGVTDAAGQTITVEGGGAMAQVLPPSLEQTFGGTSRLSASARLPANSATADIDHISLDNEAFRFNLSGLADWEGETSNLVAEIAAKNAEALFDLPETGSLGKASIAGLKAGITVTGSLKSPDWRITIDWADLASDRIALKPFSARLEGHGLIATAAAPVTFSGSLNGEVGQGRDGSLPPALTGPLSGSVSGDWRADGLLGIASASLSIGTSTVEATGTINPFGGNYDLNVTARTDSPATGAALLDKLLDGQVAASAHITGGGPDGFSLEDLRFSSPAITVNSTGRADGKTADLSLSVSLPDLGVLRNGIGGQASFDASLKGPWSALDAALDGAGENVRLLNKDLDAPKFVARITFSDGRPQGDISMSGTLGGRPVGIHGSFDTDATGATILRDFNASSGSARASGSLVWPAAGHPTGKITFDAPDLRDVGPLLLLDLSGAMAGGIDMTGGGAGHKTAITFTGRDIASGGFAAGKAEGSVTITGLFDQPQPSGSATFGKLRIGSQLFDTATIKAEPNGADGWRTTASVKGRDLSADAEADVVMAKDSTTITLARLSGKLRGTAFKAAAPFVMRQTNDGVSIDSATLNVGKGTVKLAGRMSPSLDLRAGISALPLGAFESLARVPGLRGTLSGDATLKGSFEALQGQYKLSVTGLTASALEGLRIKPLTASANGTISGQTITATLKADGGTDLSITADGKADLARSTIDMKLKGKAGSRLFNDRLAENGLRAEGNVSFDLRIAGPLAKPAIDGEIALAKGVIGDTAGQFTVRDAQGRASIGGNVIRIVSLTGKTGRKGTVSASGTISLDASLNADLRVSIKDGIYSDGSFVTSRYNADLSISGPLRGGPTVTGEVGLRDTKITLSELPRSAIKPDDVKHIRAPAPVRRQAKELERFRQGGGSSLRVDLTLRALDPISVSGRGLNVVLTGGLRVFGPLNNLGAQGSFEMLRGRLALPARNLDFERGSLTFDRNFDPLINFVAVSRRTDATITLAVTGHASEPSIKVTSVPQMPEEEALARLIFNSSMLELSPIQIAQIASYVATVTGGGDGGILSGLQAAMGLEFTVGTSEKGETQVGVARQINDRLSVGVEQTTKSNTTRVNIDLSATPNVKLRGSVDSDRSSRIGVYYEKDY